jgi:hypothetical protein
MLVCVSGFLCAQSGNQPKFSVSGTVVNSATSQPIPKALVQANGKVAMTDADGHFEVDGVAGPNLVLSARRPGFNETGMSQVNRKMDSNLENITVKLVPQSKISGRILDRDGEPVEGVLVQCSAREIVNGRKQWQPRGSVSTDETGSYVMEDLMPGTYILHTREKQLYFTQPKTEAARYVFPPTYYPDSPTQELAQSLTLTPGGEARADFSLQAVRGTRITMTTVPEASNVMTSIFQGEDQFGGSSARMSKTGEFIFPAVPPGTWNIVARGPFGPRQGEGNEPAMYGEIQVEVGATDIDNLKLPLGKLADITATVSGQENAGVQLQLFSKNGTMTNELSATPGGESVMSGVSPGSYRVVARSAGSTGCVTALTSGSQDLLHDDLVVSAGATVPAIQAVVSSNCPQLTVNSSSGQTATVVVTSDNKQFEPQLGYISSQSGAVINGLTEGDYKVCAFDDITDLEYANPEALRDFKCSSVHLEAGQKATVQAEINERRPK